MATNKETAAVFADFFQELGYRARFFGGERGRSWVTVVIEGSKGEPLGTLTVENDELTIMGRHARHLAARLDKRLADGKTFDCGGQPFACVRLR